MLLRAMSVLVLTASCLLASRALADEIVLADAGKSDYQIVLADDASPSTRHGAEELQSFLEQITGAKLPIVSDQKPLGPQEIILGQNAHSRELGLSVDFKSLGHEGYVIRTVGQRLVIAGGPLRGNMYGVYGFLEDHLGCHWFAPGVSHIPKSARLAVAAIDDRQVPALEYRNVYLNDCFNTDWCARNRMNSTFGKLDDRHGGKVSYAKDLSVHSFNRLIPPEKYFAKHPEYFSMIRGRRRKDHSQLCCTNPEVIRLCTEEIRRAMRAQPQATAFSVSQNDWDGHCECQACQTLARREGSQIAPVLQLVNRVAEEVEREFPDKLVDTLAYTWTRHAPRTMRPRRNVVVRLCSIECCFSHPLQTCDSRENREFRADLAAWGKIAPRLWVWDYATDFRFYLLPFPNQRVRGPNVRFYVAHNVKGIFEQDTFNTPQSELAALGGYITAKCLWNPNCDSNRAIVEFLRGYYGPAAPPIREYINLLHDRVERENIHVYIAAKCDSEYLPDELLIKANRLWQRAERLAAANPEILQRVRLSRMSVDFALLERARLISARKLSIDQGFLEIASERFAPFFQTLQSSNLTRLGETDPLDKEAYRRDLARALRIKL
jgi:hypothetical protein